MISLRGLARRYRDKYGMEMPTLKLARIMYSDNKLLFSNVENARKALRVIEGKSGSRLISKNIANDKYFLKEKRPLNPYKLPESDAKDLPPFSIKGHNRVLIIGDVHLPYHSVDAITSCFNYAKKEKPDLVILNGDITLLYVKDDPEQVGRTFVGIIAGPGFIILQLSYIGEVVEVYDFEVTDKPDMAKLLNFNEKEDKEED